MVMRERGGKTPSFFLPFFSWICCPFHSRKSHQNCQLCGLKNLMIFYYFDITDDFKGKLASVRKILFH